MVTYEEYLRGVLRQVDDSFTLLQNLKDKPGDLQIIQRELAKINGLLQALGAKLVGGKTEFSEYEYLGSPIRHYLDSFDFFREIETMSLLYSDDPMRLRNLRASIVDALGEKNLIGHVKAILKADG